MNGVICLKGYAKTYKCPNCNKSIDPMRNHICPYCGYEQPLENRAYALGDAIVDIKCSQCGFAKSFYRTDKYLDTAYCPKCGETTFSSTDGKMPLPIHKPAPTVICPYCRSKNTNKISNISKATSAALFGILALGKTTKEWHCNDCGSNF